METKPTSPAIKGLLISLVLIVFGLVLYFTGLGKQQGVQFLQYVILGGGIIWACIDYAKKLEGNVTFGNTFAHGFKVTAAITAIIAVYTFIALKFIMPEMLDYTLEQARKGMAENKQMNAEQIDQALEMTKKFFIPFAIAAFLIFGVIFSLIGAAVAKKNPNYNPLQNQ